MPGTAALILGLLDGATTTATGPAQCIQGQAIRYVSQQWDMPLNIVASLKGASPTSCTILIEESNDNSSYTTLMTISLNATTRKSLTLTGATKKRYIRARVSASSGTNVIDCTMTVGGA